MNMDGESEGVFGLKGTSFASIERSLFKELKGKLLGLWRDLEKVEHEIRIEM